MSIAPHGEISPYSSSIPFNIVIDKCTQGSEPGLVAPPPLDRGAVYLLPCLPLTGSLYRPWIRFRPQAGVVPSQSASRNDPPDGRFGRASQLFIIHLNEEIYR